MASDDASGITSLVNTYVTQDAGSYPEFTGSQLTAFNYLIGLLPYNPRDFSAAPFPPHGSSDLSPYLTSKPDNISQDDWNAVTAELQKEMNYAKDIDDYFGKVSAFVTDVFVSNTTYMSDTVLNDVQQEGDATTTFVVSTMISLTTKAIGAVPIPGAGVVSGVIGAVANYVQHSADLDANTVSSDISSAGAALTKSFNDCVTAVQTMEQTILGKPASVMAMGAALDDGTLKWPAVDDQLRQAAILSYSIQMWQEVLPKFWYIMNYQDDPTYYDSWTQSDTDSYIAANPNYYITTAPSGGGVNVTMLWLGRGQTSINSHTPEDSLCIEIFTNLNVLRSDLFTEQNGWTGFTKQEFLKNGGCPSAGMTEMAMASRFDVPKGAAPAPLDIGKQLNDLRKFRDTISTSPMGNWYVQAYYAISDEIVNLYNTDPSIKQAIAQYDGLTLWNDILALAANGTFPSNIDMDTSVQNALAIVSAVQQSASNAGATNVLTAINELISNASDYMNVKTEDDLVAAIAAETPPQPNFPKA